MTTKKDNPNLFVWNLAEPTDEKHTKTFKKGGGFGGTSINATYLFKRATEVFGPVGFGWGFKVIDERYVEGAINTGGVVDKVHVIRIEFWWKDPENREVIGSFESYGQTQMVGVNKNGGFTDEEAPKKSLTDAITKALSMLGFASEIHMGLWDDNKYQRAFGREDESEKAERMERERREQEEVNAKLAAEGEKAASEILAAEDLGRCDFLITKNKGVFERLKLANYQVYVELRKRVSEFRDSFTTKE